MDLDVVRDFTRATALRWGSEVRRVREERGFTQVELTALIDGLSPQTISKVERGQIDPRDYLKIAIAAGLRVEPSELFALPRLDDVIVLFGDELEQLT